MGDISKRGFGSNHELARIAGRRGGGKSKGRVLSEAHKQKLREAQLRRHQKDTETTD